MEPTVVPHDLEIALHDDPEAGTAFAAPPFSHKRESIDRILEAKRPETRAQRIEKTLETVREKPRDR